MDDILTVEQTAEFLGITDVRVKRLVRESLLNNVSDDAENPQFKADEVKRYKELADRIGGI
ncbi:helix-turn-helix domain-containing protein [Psychrobium sp. 1_MG-2023]|uniref:helix-turn-helix domain-containing protein n=1 Tax=Psychrobium sp. 1_MG-2023 TaxID=3062624 RepID=UPI000C343DC8|nr:helix-turn-helix domain-containing protein [Psychrobium sp. 1_MG-2023]MDP2559923.1 helix-turn-helix domain-containing protein [Psychrobium sp. 1_MG-2023]PKF58976.1 helix-turn-helix domain-containing protein [Alteromonadales bacterium alter-6D02]